MLNVAKLIGIAGFLVIWEAAGRYLGANLLAPPSDVASAFFSMAREGTVLVELARSLRQLALGFGLACLLGMPLGVAMGRSKAADAIFHPWVSMLVVMSAAALVPLFIVLLGTGFAFRTAIVFMASVWYIALTVYQGAASLSPRFIDAARSFGASRLRIFFQIILPALYPYLVAALRIGFVHALRAMVMAEMFVLVGFGNLIYQSGLEISTAPVLALIVMLMIVSLVVSRLISFVGEKTAPWYHEKTALSRS